VIDDAHNSTRFPPFAGARRHRTSPSNGNRIRHSQLHAGQHYCVVMLFLCSILVLMFYSSRVQWFAENGRPIFDFHSVSELELQNSQLHAYSCGTEYDLKARGATCLLFWPSCVLISVVACMSFGGMKVEHQDAENCATHLTI
jgi:hypothetical protein